MRKGNVFINYRREDSAAWTGRLHDRLMQSLPTGRIFIDIDNIDPGQDFARLLDEQVAQCDIFLAVIGRKWLDVRDQSGNRRIDNPSDYVRIEIASALKRDNVHVIPVLVDGAQIPSQNELPEDINQLVQRNALEISRDRFHLGADRLLKTVRAVLPWRVRHRRTIRFLTISAITLVSAAAFYMAIYTSKLETALGLEKLIRPSAIEWNSLTYLDKTNPAYLRDFINRYGQTLEGREASRWLADITDRAWSKIADTTDLNQISDFLSTFRTSTQAESAANRLAELKSTQTHEQKPASLIPLSRFRDCPDCPEMIVIPPGRFVMGSLESERFRVPDAHEGPRQPITIPDQFAVGRFEVTLKEFNAFVKDTGHPMGEECIGIRDPVNQPGGWGDIPGRNYTAPGFEQGEDHPVVCVSWDDATAYTRWLSSKTGGNYRLLTEAEWEYAARAGSDDRYTFGDEESRLCQFGNGADRGLNVAWEANRWCADGKLFGTAAVGSYRPNAFGLRDVHGNVHEWVADCYHNSYENMPLTTQQTSAAWTSPSCAARVIRGGCWAYPPDGLRSARRESWEHFKRSFCVGLRVAKTLEPQ